MKKQTLRDLTPAINALRHIAPRGQIAAMLQGLNGEEWQHFAGKLHEYAARFQSMPKPYETDGKGGDAIAYLHLFQGSIDLYIIERDSSDEQLQAFGLANHGYGLDLGYINIQEAIDNGVELDLFWEPIPTRDIPGSVEVYGCTEVE